MFATSTAQTVAIADHAENGEAAQAPPPPGERNLAGEPDVNGPEVASSGDQASIRYGQPGPASPSSTKSAAESAFRLLGNLASADAPRRRIMRLDGVVLAAARAVSASAVALASSPVLPDAVAACESTGAGKAASALLGRLAPVLGAEGDEQQLIAAGEALSAAVVAVSTYGCDSHADRCAGHGAAPGLECDGGGESSDGPPPRRNRGGDGGGGGFGGVEGCRRLGFALEALSGLLVLSWSDASSLEAAAAVDSVVTDARLTQSVVSLWRRGAATGATAASVTTPFSDFGTVCSVSLAFLSSVAYRPAGRQALIAAGVASAVVGVAVWRDGGDNEGSELTAARRCLPLPVSDRSELLRLLCVLCASPAHRAAVWAALATCGARETPQGGGSGEGGGATGADSDEESESAVEAAIVRLQGGSGGGAGGTQECHAGASRLALLLGVSAPPPAFPARRRPSAFPADGAAAGVATRASLSPNGGVGSPPEVKKRRSTSATRSPSPPACAGGAGVAHAFSERRGSGGGGGTRGTTAAGEGDHNSSMDLEELEEELFPTDTVATPASGAISQDALGSAVRESPVRFANASSEIGNLRAP